MKSLTTILTILTILAITGCGQGRSSGVWYDDIDGEIERHEEAQRQQNRRRQRYQNQQYYEYEVQPTYYQSDPEPEVRARDDGYTSDPRHPDFWKYHKAPIMVPPRGTPPPYNGPSTGVQR